MRWLVCWLALLILLSCGGKRVREIPCLDPSALRCEKTKGFKDTPSRMLPPGKWWRE